MKVQIVSLNRLPFLPYVYGLLRAYIEDAEPKLASQLVWAEPIFLDHANQRAADFVRQIPRDVNVVGFSCYVWNFKKQMKIARLLKERNPDVRIVAGGPHVPNDTTGFFIQHPYVDNLVHGEGEIKFTKVLKGVQPSGPSATEDMLPKNIQIRSPYTRGYFHESITALQKAGIEFWVPWETNRGCPYQCSFCDWGSSLVNKVRRFDQKRLEAEIQYFAHAQIKNIYICDANFGMLPRDLELANMLAEHNENPGYPKSIRASFAKNSNDRVFEITKRWHERGMVHGATLSMQSVDSLVLDAIDRKNIPIKHYADLQTRYDASKLPTYTELILGLPGETKESFQHGIANLLEAGNHDDIRVFELSILPNAPIAPKVKEFGARVIDKQLFVEFPHTEVDEVERTQIVYATDTMPLNDWIECHIFSTLVQTLHCGYYTRFISQYLRRRYKIPYYKFYAGLIPFYEKESSVLGTLIGHLKNDMTRYVQDTDFILLRKAVGYGNERRNLSDWSWLWLNDHIDDFYKELWDYVYQVSSQYMTKVGLGSYAMADVMKFNQAMILTPTYNPDHISFSNEMLWDVYGYFYNGHEVMRSIPNELVFHTRTMGADHIALKYGSRKQFAKAVVGDDFLVSRVGRYIHQDIDIHYTKKAIEKCDVV